MLFKKRRDLAIIGTLCVGASPSSLMLSEAKLVPVHLHMAPICCLIKECLPPVNEMPKEASVRPLTSLSLVCLDRRDSSVCSRQKPSSEMDAWTALMTDSSSFSFAPPAEKPWVSNKCPLSR